MECPKPKSIAGENRSLFTPGVEQIVNESSNKVTYRISFDSETSIEIKGEIRSKILGTLLESTSITPLSELAIINQIYADDPKFSISETNPFSNRLSIAVNAINAQVLERNNAPYRISRLSNNRHKTQKDVQYYLKKTSSMQQVFPSDQSDEREDD